MKQKYFTKIMALLLIMLLSIAAIASGAVQASAKSPISYTVTVRPEGKGQLYWNYGSNMEFFLLGKDSYNGKCLIKSGEKYKFSTLIDRGFIAVPKDGWYFEGVFDQAGRSIVLSTTQMDMVRITVKGFYYYDYIPSYDNPAYRRYTKERYREEMKLYIKALYGVKTYKVLGSAVLYSLPKKDGVFYPRFKEKKSPAFPTETSLSKALDDADFYIIPKSAKQQNVKFSSSNSKIIQVDKTSGLAGIKGPGKAIITIKYPETDKTLAAVCKVTITVSPQAVTGLSASRSKDKKKISVNWKKDIRYSGYQLQVSPDKSFKVISAKKTVSSGKQSSTTISTSKSAKCAYIRIRPYKTSGGEKLYGKYTVCAVK